MSRAALYALARAIDAQGDNETAIAAVRLVDPFSRSSARRAVRVALADAWEVTTFRQGHDGELHIMRLAFLRVAGAPFARERIDDPEHVATAYEAARAKLPTKPPTWWRAFIALGLFVLALGFVGFWAKGALLPRDASERPGPEGKGAYAKGGRPRAADPVLMRVFTHDLPDFLILLDRRAELASQNAPAEVLGNADREIDKAAEKLFADDARAALGAGGFAALGDLVAKCRAASRALLKVRDEDPTSDALMEAVGKLDDELAAGDTGFFVDGDVMTDLRNGKRIVILYSFAVERVTPFVSGSVVVRALEVRRIDNLNWSHALLGFTRPHLRDAIVLLDAIERQVVTYLGPALVPGGKMPLFDADDPDPARDAIETRASELARKELSGDAGGAARDRLAGLLARRHQRFRACADRLRARGLILQEPSKLRLDADFEKSLRGAAPEDLLDEILAIDKDLGDAASNDAFHELVDALVASVQRHEVQHRLDFARSFGLPTPSDLEKLTGPSEKKGDLAWRARGELSAYLAEIARDEKTTMTNVALISRFLFSRTQQGVPESYAAVVIVESLAKELGVAGDPVVRARSIDHAAVASAFLAITGKSSAEVRAGAKRAWEKLYGGTLPDLERR